MEKKKEDHHFEILGQKLRISPEASPEHVTPEEIVRCVDEEAQKVLKKSPGLDKSQVAVLVALQLAGEKLGLEREYRDNIEKLQTSTHDALKFIESASPNAL